METTFNLWDILEEDTVLKPISLMDSNHVNNAILFDANRDTDDGTYPRVCDYMRVVNKLESDGPASWINRLSRKKNKLKIDFGGVTIIRDKCWQDEAVLEFKEPIKVVFGWVGEEPIIKEVKKIKGEFTHDWFWTSQGRQDKVANGFEIYFNIHKYLE